MVNALSCRFNGIPDKFHAIIGKILDKESTIS